MPQYFGRQIVSIILRMLPFSINLNLLAQQRARYGIMLFVLAPIILMPLKLKAEERHRFWDGANLQLLGANVVAQTVDAYSTQGALNRGAREINPIARPLVNLGWKGQLMYSYGVGVGGTLAASYFLHRLGHHKWERITPFIVATSTGIVGGLNFRF